MDNYIDKINNNNTEYDIQDSKAARSVDGTTKSHVLLSDNLFSGDNQEVVDSFIFRTTAGAASVETGIATLDVIYGNTEQIGHTDEVLVESHTFADQATTVSLNKTAWRTQVSTDGIYTFTYGTAWTLEGQEVNLADYGLTVTGTVAEGDSITVRYTALVIGTLTTATPTSFAANGFNQYNATAGYARVVGGQEYRIDGTYTSLTFSTTATGTQTPLTVTDNKFTPAEDGYVFVQGGSGDILIALRWSGMMDTEPYVAYEEFTVAIPITDTSSTALPTASYGMPSVGEVRDELRLSDGIYIQRIGHYAYSAQNLATVEAMGVAYVYDLSDIFYVLENENTYTTTPTGGYTANDYGTEWFNGTNVPVLADILYGHSLKDKLRNLADIQSIGSGLTLSNGELSASGGGGFDPYDESRNYSDIVIPDGPNYTPNNTAVYISPRVSGTLIPQNRTVNILGKSNNIYTQSVQIGYGAEVTGTNAIAIGECNSAARAIAIGSDYTGASGTDSIAIGQRATANANGNFGISMGYRSSVTNVASLAFGYYASASGPNSVALGREAKATRGGEVNIGTGTTTVGYNSTSYRVLGGVHPAVDDHDAVTLGQMNARILAGGTAAPTTSTVGEVGTLYAYVESGTGHLAICTAVDASTSTYTWQTLI